MQPFVTERVEQVMPGIERFVKDEALPLEDVLRQEGFGAILPQLAQKRERVKALGMWTPHLPEELGGLGLSLTEFAHVSEALGRSPLGHYLFNCQAPDIGNMEILHSHGTEEQQERYFRPLIEGRIRKPRTAA